MRTLPGGLEENLNKEKCYESSIRKMLSNVMIKNKNYFMEKWKEHLKSDNILQRYKAKQFIEIINNAEAIKNFDMDLYFRIVEKMTVFEGKKIIVTLLEDTEIECEIE